jgi:long-chain acyl-CoA synthetase
MMENSFAARRDRLAINDRFGSLTYSSLGEAILKVEERLVRIGVGKGDCVALDCDGRDLIIFTFAVMYLGACAVAVPRQYTGREKEALFERCAVTIFICPKGSERLSHGAAELQEDGLTDIFQLTHRPAVSQSSLLKIPVTGAAFLRFTSGSTGESKGVLFGESSLVERVVAANKGLGICEEDVVLWVLPMAYHFIVSIILYLQTGASIVIPENTIPETVRNAIKKNRVSVIYANEYFFKMLIAHCGKDHLKSIKKTFSTSVGISEKTAMDFYKKFGVPIRQAYGIIEVGLPFVNVDKPLEKPRSVGRILPDYQVQIVDDEGAQVPAGKVGEVCLKGCGFFDAYLSPFRPRDEVCSGGWFHTGDMGSLDEEGYLYLFGRRGDVINSMGMKIFPSEIEEVLNQHPSIKRSLVRAVPHPYLNEVPGAIIIPYEQARIPEADELISFCGQYLAAYKIPRSFVFTESLPETGSGKLRRPKS